MVHYRASLLVIAVVLLVAMPNQASGASFGTMRAELPTGRAGAAVAQHNASAYLFLGCLDEFCHPTREVWKYTPGLDVVEVMEATIPDEVPTRGAAVWTPHGIFVFIVNVGTYRYDEQADSFEDVGVTVHGMVNYGSIPQAGITISGFWDERSLSPADCPSGCVHLLVADGKVWRFDPAKRELSSAPVAVLPFAPERQVTEWGFAWTGDHAWLLGGLDYVVAEDQFETSDRIIRYDPVANSASVLDMRLPEPLWGPAVAGNESTLFVYGGQNHMSQVHSEVITVDVSSAALAGLSGTLPIPLRGASAIWQDGLGFVLGGQTPQPCCPEYRRPTTVFRHDPLRDNEAPVARIEAAIATTTNGLVLRLDGTQSFDADGDIIFWDWFVDHEAAGQTAVLDLPVEANASYRVALTVTDDAYVSANTTELVGPVDSENVTDPGPTSPVTGRGATGVQAPLAVAGCAAALMVLSHRRRRHSQ